MTDRRAAEYLKTHGVDTALSSSLQKLLRDRPADPLTALGQMLVEISEKEGNPLNDEELRKIEKPIASQVRAVWLAKELFGLVVVKDSVKDLDSYDDRNFYFRATSQRPELSDPLDCHAHEAEPELFHYVLKVHNGVESLSPGFIECQNLAMECIRKAGVWCPRALPAVDGAQIAFAEQPLGNKTLRKHAVRCLPYRPASLLGGVVATRALLIQLGAVAAKVSSALLSFEHPDAYRKAFIWDLAQALAVRPLLKHLSSERQLIIGAVLDELEARVMPLSKAGKLRRGVIHGDINDQNVLVGPSAAAESAAESGAAAMSVLGIIDFGDMCHTWVVNEIAISIAYAIIALHYDKGGDGGEAGAGGGGEEMSEVEAACAMASSYSAEMSRLGMGLSDAEWRALPTLIACRIAVSLTIGAYSSAMDPTNEYLKITLLPGLKALQRLRQTSADDLEAAMRKAAAAAHSKL